LLNKLLRKRKTYLITRKENEKKTKPYKKIGFKIIFFESLEKKKDFLILYKKIYKLGYSRIFVECGLTFLNTLIKNKLINDLYIFKNDNKLGANGKNNTSSEYLKRLSTKLIQINLKDDKLYIKNF